MTELYARVLLWHKLVAQTTGGLALCSAKHRLNRDEAIGWATALRNVADEIEAVLAGHGFILDSRGQRGVGSGYRAALVNAGLPMEPRSDGLDFARTATAKSAQFFTKEAGHDEDVTNKAKTGP